MELDIVQVGNPVLRSQAFDIKPQDIGKQHIQELLENMVETMRAAPGVGLAAPQIGLGLCIFVAEYPADQFFGTDPLVLSSREIQIMPLHICINPRLTVETSEQASWFEGCLSIDDYTAQVARYSQVRIDALDHNGDEFTARFTGWSARIMQHETDHLAGTLYIDHADLTTFSTSQNYVEFLRPNE